MFLLYLQARIISILAFLQDDSDYVKTQGCFFPGVMLKADSGDQSSAGIAVERHGETRLTVAFHCWEREHAQAPEKLGKSDHLKVTQGETEVGFVEDRIGTTDIGLVKLDQGVVFNNRFLDIPTVPKAGNDFAAKDLPSPGVYVSTRQGVYATGSPEIHGVPKNRAGMCGSAIVRVMSDGENVLENGEILGFMHWSDLQFKNDTAGSLYCFANSVDELITDGWHVVQVLEKRKHGADEDGRTNPQGYRQG